MQTSIQKSNEVIVSITIAIAYAIMGTSIALFGGWAITAGTIFPGVLLLGGGVALLIASLSNWSKSRK